MIAELNKLAANHPVTAARAATAFIRATTWDIEPVSNPVTELSGLLDFIERNRFPRVHPYPGTLNTGSTP